MKPQLTPFADPVGWFSTDEGLKAAQANSRGHEPPSEPTVLAGIERATLVHVG